jgi:hypothetical protein
LGSSFCKDPAVPLRKLVQALRPERTRRNKSFPAFSNASSNQDPGTGTSSSGAQTGFMNRNLDWNEPIETAARYEVLIKQFSASVAPVTMDVTLRRLQRFRFAPGSALKAVNINSSSQTIQEKAITVDNLGLASSGG